MNQGVFRAVSIAVIIVFVAAAGWLIWQDRQSIPAPRDPGVCWRMVAGRFEPLVRNSLGIEACAGDLERIHMKTGEDLTGAYQGRYIFVDKEAIRSSDRVNGQHWRLYFDNQRDALDKKLNAHEMTFITQRDPAPSP